MKYQKSRVRLSVVALQTKNLLFYLLLAVAVLLAAGYLFTLNHIAFRGYVLQNETRKNQDLLSEISYIDVKIAKIQTRENLEKALKYSPMVAREREKFVIVKPSFTAKAETPIRHTLQ